MTLLSEKQINALLKALPLALRKEAKLFLLKNPAFVRWENDHDVLLNLIDHPEELIKIHYCFTDKITYLLQTGSLKDIIPLIDVPGIYKIDFLFKRSFLDHAMENKNSDVIEYVIDLAKINKVDLSSFFPLYRAALHGNLTAIKLLIHAGANYSVKTPSRGDIFGVLASQAHFELIQPTQQIIDEYQNSRLIKPTSSLRHRHIYQKDFYNSDEYGFDAKPLNFFTLKSTVPVNKKNEIISTQNDELFHLGL